VEKREVREREREKRLLFVSFCFAFLKKFLFNLFHNILFLLHKAKKNEDDTVDDEERQLYDEEDQKDQDILMEVRR
jgi:hypothetical protein